MTNVVNMPPRELTEAEIEKLGLQLMRHASKEIGKLTKHSMDVPVNLFMVVAQMAAYYCEFLHHKYGDIGAPDKFVECFYAMLNNL